MRVESEMPQRRPWSCPDCNGLVIGDHYCETTGRQFREAADGDVTVADDVNGGFRIVRRNEKPRRTSGGFAAY